MKEHLTFALLGVLATLLMVFAFAACGGGLFPKCDDKTRPNGGCAPYEPDYPARARDAAADG